MAVLQVNNRYSQVTIDINEVTSIQKSSDLLGNPILRVKTSDSVFTILYEDYKERDKDFEYVKITKKNIIEMEVPQREGDVVCEEHEVRRAEEKAKEWSDKAIRCAVTKELVQFAQEQENIIDKSLFFEKAHLSGPLGTWESTPKDEWWGSYDISVVFFKQLLQTGEIMKIVTNDEIKDNPFDKPTTGALLIEEYIRSCILYMMTYNQYYSGILEKGYIPVKDYTTIHLPIEYINMKKIEGIYKKCNSFAHLLSMLQQPFKDVIEIISLVIPPSTLLLWHKTLYTEGYDEFYGYFKNLSLVASNYLSEWFPGDRDQVEQDIKELCEIVPRNTRLIKERKDREVERLREERWSRIKKQF